ncbi:hypothetical protein BDY17DRAFT_104458 [Neohortaea acidophila]|uniref:Uncharacterized protein n=1 Tax=Neohortaea acidophila TaxID=245834 RepID=A0A6A6PZC3_9PEZI|nr:uncharacterized protein BDY17DRAFT_104458 [Neohortaea acidophila]KAF2485480.1 hypothetical protein BDY17DRAFT_104458 [Neohortaea acidophila]
MTSFATFRTASTPAASSVWLCDTGASRGPQGLQTKLTVMHGLQCAMQSTSELASEVCGNVLHECRRKRVFVVHVVDFRVADLSTGGEQIGHTAQQTDGVVQPDIFDAWGERGGEVGDGLVYWNKINYKPPQEVRTRHVLILKSYFLTAWHTVPKISTPSRSAVAESSTIGSGSYKCSRSHSLKSAGVFLAVIGAAAVRHAKADKVRRGTKVFMMSVDV